MIKLSKITLSAFIALGLAACGGNSQDHAKMDEAKMDGAKMDHSTMNHGKKTGDTGHTTGVIISISPDGKVATIDHKEIAGVGMGAMTMGFGIISAVDLSDYAAGDNVSFMVKKGRDNGYRITAICNTNKDGKACLDAKMDHSGH